MPVKAKKLKAGKPRKYCYNLRLSLTEDDAAMLREAQRLMEIRMNVSVSQTSVLRAGLRKILLSEQQQSLSAAD